MENTFKKVLFQHNILVSDRRENSEEAFAVCYALAKLFGIRITKGAEMLQEEMIPFAAAQLGKDVPEPFYRGFPASVRALSPEQLLFDQIVHYTKTYGFGMFDEQGHSIMEKFIERTAFHEKTTPKVFVVLNEEEAVVKLKEYADNMLQSTRPLSEERFAFLCDFIRAYDYEPDHCMSKNTAIRLLLAFRDPAYAQFLVMSDVPKLVDELNVRDYKNANIKKLNLKNQDRKLITTVINTLLHADNCDIRTCCEKKAVWNGLLHHIHYKPVNELSVQFVSCIRGKGNPSVYSEFERAMAAGDIREAVLALKNGKGSGAVLRRLNYILSRCESEADVDFVMDQIRTSNGIILMQLLMKYSRYRKPAGPRSFSFERHNMTVVHRETDEEVQRRKSFISQETAQQLCVRITENLKRLYAGRLGRVYVDPDMKRIAVPVQMSASSGGWGVLPRGSRLKIEKGKKVRAFTYWEKVRDIDLSVIGIRADWSQLEFSWRTMADLQSDAITYSGDETSGFHGGSEYFDIDLQKIREMYPELEYLVFCDNVYSGFPFTTCICIAGYMLRDITDSGEVFEPKTVNTSFRIDCDSTFAYLFAIDLGASEFIWLNTVKDSSEIVAGSTCLDFLAKYFEMTSVMNVYDLFEMMSTELADTPAEAEIVVSDKASDAAERGKGVELIRSCDVERIMALMN